MGELRERVGRMLDWYQDQLSSQEPLRVAKAGRKMERFFDLVEDYVGDASMPDPEDLIPPEES